MISTRSMIPSMLLPNGSPTGRWQSIRKTSASMTITRKREPSILLHYIWYSSDQSTQTEIRILNITFCFRWTSTLFRSLPQQNKNYVFFEENMKEKGVFSTKLLAYKTFVRLFLEYGCKIWLPHTRTNIRKSKRYRGTSYNSSNAKLRRQHSCTNLLFQAFLHYKHERKRTCLNFLTHSQLF